MNLNCYEKKPEGVLLKNILLQNALNVKHFV